MYDQPQSALTRPPQHPHAGGKLAEIESELNYAMRCSDEAVRELVTMLELLNNKLEPVLVPDHPTPISSNKNAPERPVASSFANRIVSHAGAISNSTRIVQNLLNRLAV